MIISRTFRMFDEQQPKVKYTVQGPTASRLTAQSIYRWATDWLAGVQLSAGAINFYLLHSAQTDSGAQPASYRFLTLG